MWVCVGGAQHAGGHEAIGTAVRAIAIISTALHQLLHAAYWIKYMEQIERERDREGKDIMRFLWYVLKFHELVKINRNEKKNVI